ncbi:hypothetical protein F4781DRAFT_380204 [Annulohypoxylon bovei var. microspora]|nr:hypothetical protein F4781DRAFT_380204 [Annulohypoxylon bovei var. microspora]
MSAKAIRCTMHRSLSSRWLKSALNIAEHPGPLELPLFLCSSIHRALPRQRLGAVASSSHARASRWRVHNRCLHMQSTANDLLAPDNDIQRPLPLQNLPTIQLLPRQCRGCGALSQTTSSGLPGYFDLSRKSVINYLQPPGVPLSRPEDTFYERALSISELDDLRKKGIDVDSLIESLPPPEMFRREPPKLPVCDRCHKLQHNHAGESISHPSIDSIRETIAESPHKHNYIYHVVDAADFPLSLLPRIVDLLDTAPLRTKNRRSKSSKFYSSWKTELSFVITRCDLLAPTIGQVERLFPYLQEVLRDALGRTGRNVRLGNVIAVSSKQNWRTKKLKEDIFKRGGASWLVGKVNVGKSKLVEEVFPKGRMNRGSGKKRENTINTYSTISYEEATSTERAEDQLEPAGGDIEAQVIEGFEEEDPDEYSLLPPAPEETPYPDMPLVSDLPGTTASPIRLPFGSGRGELIDLPGLERTGLDRHVQKKHRLSLVMRKRIVPIQQSISPGQSLLLGGFIRITPREPAPQMLMYSFTPLHPHVTRTERAEAIQQQGFDIDMNKFDFENISVPGTGEKTKHAGSFELKWDVTKQRTGPLMKGSIGLSLEQLPYRVMSTDILIEGVGWVEIVAQVRTKDIFEQRPKLEELSMVEPRENSEPSALERLEALAEDPKKKPPAPRAVQEEESDRSNFPIVDVYSPEGKFISCRRPMNGWVLNRPLRTEASQRSRPRRSMKGMKKLEKMRRRT